MEFHVDPEVQAAIDLLAEKANDGILSEEERSQYEDAISAADFISLFRLKALRRLLRNPAEEGGCGTGSEPEGSATERENQELAVRVLGSLPERDREALIRYYLNKESPTDICRALNLIETQFRMIKSRARACFDEVWQRWLLAS